MGVRGRGAHLGSVNVMLYMHTFYLSNFINVGQRKKKFQNGGETKNDGGTPKTSLLKMKTNINLP